MTQIPPDPPPTWLGWIVPVSVALGILWAVVKSYFELVSRTELKEIIIEQDKKFLMALQQQREDFEHTQESQRLEQLRLHGENRETAGQIFGRVSELEKGVSRIEGTLSGRYQAINR